MKDEKDRSQNSKVKSQKYYGNGQNDEHVFSLLTPAIKLLNFNF